MNRPILHGLTAVSLALGACASAPVSAATPNTP